MTPQQLDVAAIGLESQIENVAQDGNGAYGCVKPDIAQHASQEALRHTMTPALCQGIEGDSRGEGIADSRDEPDHPVEADPPAGAGNPERLVEDERKAVEAP